MSEHAVADRLLEELQRIPAEDEAVRLYSVLDGARNPNIHAETLTAGNPFAILFQGSMGPELEAAAPRLVELRGGGQDAFSEWLAREGYGDSWGIYARSAAPLKELRKHFRTFLMVKTEDGDKVYFRYYDPRVLRVYLPTCTHDELDYVFGPVREYLVEGEECHTFHRFRRSDDGGLVQETVRLGDGESAESEPPCEASAPEVSEELSLEAITADLRGMRDRLREAQGAGEEQEAIEAQAIHAALVELQQRVAQAGEAEEVEALRKGLKRVMGRLAYRKEINAKAVSAALTTLLIALDRRS